MTRLFAALLGALFFICVAVVTPAKAGSFVLKINACTKAKVVGGMGFPDGAGPEVRSFYGIPFAAPPINGNRWLPPKPFHCWKGERDAGGGAISQPCPQGGAGFGSEDCLYLNVFSPYEEPDDPTDLPVMVFFHGGALNSGNGYQFGQNPANLVVKGVVAVMVNYRLGALGFLADPALKGSAKTTGNFGILDQQAALRWVKKNISAFGGDPKNVTIFGQSAGGLSVLTHLVSPMSNGLFHKAIIESGAFYRGANTKADAAAKAMTFATAVGCGTTASAARAACLRKVPTDTLVINQGKLSNSTQLLTIDGKLLPDEIKTLLVAGKFKKVPIINGSNHHEARFNLANNQNGIGTGNNCNFQSNLVPNSQANFGGAVSYHEAIARMMAGSPPNVISQTESRYSSGNTPLSANLAFAQALTDVAYACRPFRASQFIAKKHKNIYAYELNDSHAPVWSNGPITVHGGAKVPQGAYHNAELQYIFPMPKTVACGLPYPGLSTGQKTLAKDMVIYWTTFAKTGNPNPTKGTKPPEWPLFTGKTGKMLSLVATKPVVMAAHKFDTAHKCTAFWDKNTQ